MHFAKTFSPKPGLTAHYHRAVITGIQDGIVRIDIRHYANETDEQNIWRDNYYAPVSVLTAAGDPETLIADWLVSDEGPLSGAVITEEVTPTDVAKALALSAVKLEQTAIEANGLDVEGIGVVQTDLASQMRINGFATAAQIELSQGRDFSVNYTLADNTSKTLSAAEIMQLSVAVAEYVNEVHHKAQELRELVKGAANIESVRSINMQAFMRDGMVETEVEEGGPNVLLPNVVKPVEIVTKKGNANA